MHRITLILVLMAVLATGAQAQVPWLYYTSDEGGSVQIWRSHIDGSNAEQLTNFAEQATQPFVFMGGTKVGFRTAGSWPDVAGALWVMDPDGSNLEQWTDPGVINYRPYYHEGRHELWLSRTSCSETFKILDLNTFVLRDFVGGPISWSANIVGGPAGDDVYFGGCSCSAASTCDINRATLVGDELTNITPVTNDAIFDSAVQVSGAGQLAYVKSEGGGGIGAPTNIYVNSPGGGAEAPATFHVAPNEAHAPSWSFEDGVIYYVLLDAASGKQEIRRVDVNSGVDTLIHGGDGYDYQAPVAGIMFEPCNAGGPVMIAADDVPDDQGGQLRLTFAGSEHDAGGSVTPILQYELFRKVAGYSAARFTQDAPVVLQISAARIAGWEYVGSIPAHGEAEYHAVAPTLVDENNLIATEWTTEFFVRAATADPVVFYDSCPIVGMSVDNLAPAAPAAPEVAYAAGNTQVSWEPVVEDDLAGYHLYRYAWDATPESATNPTFVKQAGYVDAALDPWDYRYAVAAVDHNGNESVIVQSEPHTGVSPHRFGQLVVHQNFPNPFNPSTTISFTAPIEGRVSVRVYDQRGRLVRRLFDGEVRAGENSTVWDGKDAQGVGVSSGVYLYEVRGFGESVRKKMTLVK